MVQGPNNLPEAIKTNLVKAIPPRPQAPQSAAVHAPASQAPDSVQISPRASQVSQIRIQLQAIAEVRPDRVQEVSAKLSSLTGDSAALNAKLAEKLLTEN